MSKNFNNHPSLTNWELVSTHPKQKNWTWKTLFNFWANNIQTVIGFSLIVSLYLAYNLNGLTVFVGTILAGFIVVWMTNLSGKPCQKMGIPFPVFLRMTMGVYGARYAAILRGLVAIFMFGTQTFFISKSVGFLIRITIFSFDENLMSKEIFNQFFLELGLIDWSSLIITAIIQYYLFTSNIKTIKNIINFSGISVYLSMLFFVYIVYSKIEVDLLNSFHSIFKFDEALNIQNAIPLITVFGTMFAYFSIIIVNFGDYSKHLKNETELEIGNYSLLLNIILFSSMAVFITLGTDIFFNKQLINLERVLTNPTDIVAQLDQTNITIAVLIFVIISSVGTNLIANYIPSSYSLINFMPSKLSVKSSGLIISVLGFFIGGIWVSIISQIGLLSIVDTVAAFFGPIFGVIMVDYYFVKKQAYNPKDLFSSDPNGEYYFSGGWSLKAFYAIFIAFIFSAATIWNENFRFLQSYAWFIGAFMGGLLQYLLSKK